MVIAFTCDLVHDTFYGQDADRIGFGNPGRFPGERAADLRVLAELFEIQMTIARAT